MLSDLDLQLAEVPSVENVRDLKRIESQQVEAVIWSRAIPASVQNTLVSVSRGAFNNGRFRLQKKHVRTCVLEHFGSNGAAQSAELDWLANDIQLLADEISALFATNDLRLRLEAVTNDACRKFHADNVKVRMICTYAGPGTEFGLTENAELPDHILRTPTGQPILLKGLKWRGCKMRQLKHRSPPIKGTGQTRFVVVLEPVTPGTEQLNESYLPFP